MKNRFSTDQNSYMVLAYKVAFACLQRPHYPVLLCARICIPPSPWTECFDIEIDDAHKVIRLSGDFT